MIVPRQSITGIATGPMRAAPTRSWMPRRLLDDFFAEVHRVLDEMGETPDVVEVREKKEFDE